jgi:hypothetical protein
MNAEETFRAARLSSIINAITNDVAASSRAWNDNIERQKAAAQWLTRQALNSCIGNIEHNGIEQETGCLESTLVSISDSGPFLTSPAWILKRHDFDKNIQGPICVMPIYFGSSFVGYRHSITLFMQRAKAMLQAMLDSQDSPRWIWIDTGDMLKDPQ